METEAEKPEGDKAEEGQVARHFSALLSDAALRKSIIRLAHHIHEKAGKEFTEQTANECLQQLSQISCLQVPSVKRVMMQLNRELPNIQTKIVTYVHKKEGKPRQSVVYLDEGACIEMNSHMDVFLQKFVSAIQFVSGMDFDSLLLYRMLKSPRQTDAVLDEAEIKQYDDQVSIVDFQVGSFVPLRHHDLLDNEFCEFGEGECVAFEVYDPLLVCEDSENNVPVFIYVTVLHEIGHCDLETLFAKRYRIDLGLDRGETDVSLTRLYKITRTTAVLRIPDQQQIQGEEPWEKGTQALDLVAVLKDVRKMLTKAHQLCKEDEFRCVTKRLALMWHCRIDKESTYMLVKKTVFRYAELLNQGEVLPEEEDVLASCVEDSVDGQSARIIMKGSEQRYAREATFQMWTGGISKLNPQPGEGWRWWHTAKCDLDAAFAFCSRDVCERGHNWVCFLCYQAMEKALKGVLYLRDADNDSLQSHSLPHLARQVGDPLLQELAQRMGNEMGSHTRMRYPHVLVYPKIPADVYCDYHAGVACDLALRAVERVESLMKCW